MGEVDGSGSSGLLFEWDDQKAAINHAKHGVSFDEASSVLMDSLALFTNDLDHSTYEDRYLIIGRSDRGNLLVVSYTERGYHKEHIVNDNRLDEEDDEMRPEYDIRGWRPNPYAERYAKGPVIKPKEPSWARRHAVYPIKYEWGLLTRRYRSLLAARRARRARPR